MLITVIYSSWIMKQLYMFQVFGLFLSSLVTNVLKCDTEYHINFSVLAIFK